MEIKHPAKNGHEYMLLIRVNRMCRAAEVGSKFIDEAAHVQNVPRKIRIFSLPTITPQAAHMKLKALQKTLNPSNWVILDLKTSNKNQEWWVEKLSKCGFLVNGRYTESIRQDAEGWDGVFVCKVTE